MLNDINPTRLTETLEERRKQQAFLCIIKCSKRKERERENSVEANIKIESAKDIYTIIIIIIIINIFVLYYTQLKKGLSVI